MENAEVKGRAGGRERHVFRFESPVWLRESAGAPSLLISNLEQAKSRLPTCVPVFVRSSSLVLPSSNDKSFRFASLPRAH